ncbi:UDP-2,3-diacylglucosamine diphosphatase [Gemmatimonadota bacterium]
MGALYFISDIHLGAQPPAEEAAKEARLLDLLEQVGADGERLYILGDLYDFWFEYRHVIPSTGLRILTALQGLTERGIEVHYLTGNHDFAVGPFVSGTLGCRIHPEPLEVEWNGTRIYLHHGDGLAGKDTGYRMMTKVIRSRAAMWLWRLLHPGIGFAIAEKVSGTSRHYTTGKDFGSGDRAWSRIEVLAGGGFDYLIMGHTHVAEERRLESGCTCLNLGSWLGGGAPHARFEEGRMELTFPDDRPLTL